MTLVTGARYLSRMDTRYTARPGSGPRLLLIAAAAAALSLAGCEADDSAVPDGAEPSEGLTAEQEEAVLAADWAYAEAWLTNEPDAIMRTLTDDAVIVPSGEPAIEGREAIREFWWPPDEPPTTVTGYAVRQQEAGGRPGFAYVRGTYSLSFDYDGALFETEGTYLSLLRRGDRGWRISHRMWNDHGLD